MEDLKMTECKVSCDGEYPTLCFGTLIIEIDGKSYQFPECCLSSGGSVSFTYDWEAVVSTGKWSICEWPEDFPEDLKQRAIDAVNYTIPFGCCGGCI
jgi:hypothetical protein